VINIVTLIIATNEKRCEPIRNIWGFFWNYPLSRRALTTFKLEEEVTSLSKSSQGEVEDNREKWGDFWEKLIAI
jgi:hypothetical protein